MIKGKKSSVQTRCANLKKSSCYALLIRNGLIILMQWINSVKEFILRAYGQSNPLQAYQTEGFEMFNHMIEAIKDDVAKYIMKAQIVDNLKREEVAKGKAVIPSSDGDQKPKRKPIRVENKIGRNDPCPCGSGKKYKNCHGKVAQ